MDKVCLLLLSLAVQLLASAQARHPRVLCQRFEKNCRKYEEYCSEPAEENTTLPDNTTGNSNSNHVATMWPSCCDLVNREAASGAYNIYGPGGHFSTQQAYCDVDPVDGVWTVIQRRINGTLLFNRTWDEYVDGFGTLSGEFWYGLTNIHWFTRNGPWQLQIKLTSDNGDVYIIQYSQFQVTSSDSDYKLDISGHTGITENDILSAYNDQSFSTNDNLNNGQGAPCTDRTGWWYTGSCIADKTMNINGVYNSDKGIMWSLSARDTRYIVQTEMKIRPLNCLDMISN